MSETLTLGPFTGGLNTVSSSAIVADNELVECVNLELALDGSLQSRPPIVETTAGLGSGTFTVIGSAILAGGTYLLGSSGGGLYYKGSASDTWTLITNTIQPKVAVQYNDLVYIPAQPGSANPGGRWDGTTFTTDANMPKGEAALFYKSRMFVFPGKSATTNTSRLTYSDVITAAALTWGSGANFIDVSPGDGSKLIDGLIYNDNLMLFKESSTHVLAYDNAISTSVLRELNSVIGVSGYRCMVAHETSVFVLHEGHVYEIVNYNFERINLKVPFTYDNSTPAGTRVHTLFLAEIGDRLVVRYYNKIYVYGLLTKTWGTWESLNSDLQNFGPPVLWPSDPTVDVNDKYYAGSCLSSNLKVMKLYEDYDITNTEAMVCSIRTRNYSFGMPHLFKKLMWWGIDCMVEGEIVGRAQIVTQNFDTLWSAVAGSTWASLESKLWGAASTLDPVITTEPNSGQLARKFVKCLQTLRFREIYFEVDMNTNASTLDGPCRLYALTAIVAGKQLVAGQVN